MDCKTIQKQIELFDKEQLSLKDEENFVNHVLTCSECQEELEIYYIIEYGLSDDDTNIAGKNKQYENLIQCYDFKSLVDKKLKNSKKNIVKIKKVQHFIGFATAVSEICLLTAIALLIYINV